MTVFYVAESDADIGLMWRILFFLVTLHLGFRSEKYRGSAKPKC